MQTLLDLSFLHYPNFSKVSPLNLAVPPPHDDVRVYLLVIDITNWAELTLISIGVYAASQNSPEKVHASLIVLSSN